MSTLSRELVEKCKTKLINAKSEILNRVRESRADLYNSEDAKGGDEGDQTLRALAESEFLSMHERLRKQLMEIESALGRIDKGLYGICEETEETIEAERLLAIPWTRLSIEGAEIRESLGKKYAR
ncbi:MAG TPA: TraR/DksA C4-type zinc finger protein [Bdellovibrionales bacterium]|nr:TraR/DksA C4-type zinc finger protein [Bdellovibrionales bacterium]